MKPIRVSKMKHKSYSNCKKTEISKIKAEIRLITTLFSEIITLIPEFDILNDKILPYGLKEHTRSISWLVEQVITQQAKWNKDKINNLTINEIEIGMPDTCLHDCVIKIKDKSYYVNIKIHKSDAKGNKNDIAAVEKLYMQYVSNNDYRLLYACFGFTFNNYTIKFDEDKINVFSPQFAPIYINPRNDKIQAYYYHQPEFRSRKEFLQLLKTNSKSIVLK